MISEEINYLLIFKKGTAECEYNASTINVIGTSITLPDGNHLYFAPVRHTAPETERLQWIPIEAILRPSDDFDDDLQAALQRNWNTVRPELERASTKSSSSDAPGSELHESVPLRPSIIPTVPPSIKGATERNAEENISASHSIDTERSTINRSSAKKELSSRPSKIPLPSDADEDEQPVVAKKAKLTYSISDYITTHAATKHICYNTASSSKPVRNRKKITHHRSRRCTRRMAALLLHRRCRKICKTWVRNRRSYNRAVPHKRTLKQ